MTIFEKSKAALAHAKKIYPSGASRMVYVIVSNDGECLEVENGQGLENKDLFRVDTKTGNVKYIN